MNARSTVRERARLFFHLSENLISRIGVVLTTSSAVTLIAFWIYDFILPGPPHPYVGILLFLLLPGFFIVGLILMPVGMILRRRKLRAAGELPATFPPVSLQTSSVRRGLLLVAFASFLNIVILTFASYKGVAYMDSTTF